MFYNPYLLWNMYILMRTIHGAYITYSFFVWFFGSISSIFIYMMTFIYNPYEVKQIEDRKPTTKEIKLNGVD